MTTTAQYASVPRNGTAQISTANTLRDGTGAMSQVIFAGSAGMRVDNVTVQATGTTTAGMVRFFMQKGRIGTGISSLTFSTTTATVTTLAPHGITTGQLVTLQNAFPDEFNVTNVVATVVSPTVFTYPMPVAPTTNASILGTYATSLAVPVRVLISELLVFAVTPSGILQAFSDSLNNVPVILSPGYSLWASTNNAETFNIIPTIAGDFA